jgi:hypothetical protein
LKIINVEQKVVEKEFNPMRVFARELNIKSLQAKKESTNVELEKLLGITKIK